MPPPTCWRYAVREPTSREAWSFVELPIDDAACASLGWNVIGPALDLSSLPELERGALVRLARRRRRDLTAEDAANFSRLMARVPRISCPGYDVDGDDPQATRAIAERLIAAELSRGVRLRVAASSGLERPGLHLEFAPAAQNAARPDLLRVMMRRARIVAEDAGLIPAPGCNVSRDGVAESWIIPGSDPAAAKLDLKPLNKGEQGRQGLFRPLGGLSKSAERRKSIVPDLSARYASVITLDILAEAPPAIEHDGDRSGALSVARRRRATFAPLPPVAPKIAPLTDALAALKRPGDHHDIRLALCAVAQQNRILNRETWTQAIGRAWGDIEDARAAWFSTRDRLEAGLPCRGATWLRRRLGSRRVADISLAIAKVSGSSFSGVLQRFGRPVADEDQMRRLKDTADRHPLPPPEGAEQVARCECDEPTPGSDHRCRACFGFPNTTAGAIARINRERELGIEAVKPDWIIQRTKNAARCLRYEQREECNGCDGELSTTRMRCDWLEMCQACMVRYLNALEAELEATWRDAGPIVIIRRAGFPSRDEAMRWGRDVLDQAPTGDKAIMIPYADIGSWGVALACREDRLAMSWSCLVPYMHVDGTETTRDADALTAARIMAHTIALTGSTMQHHLDAGAPLKALEIARAIYRKRRCYLSAIGLPWPSTATVLETFKPDHEPAELCECPADSGERYIYSCCRTRAEIARARERKSLAELIRIHERLIESELVEPYHRRRRRDLAVALRE